MKRPFRELPPLNSSKKTEKMGKADDGIVRILEPNLLDFQKLEDIMRFCDEMAQNFPRAAKQQPPQIASQKEGRLSTPTNCPHTNSLEMSPPLGTSVKLHDGYEGEPPKPQLEWADNSTYSEQDQATSEDCPGYVESQDLAILTTDRSRHLNKAVLCGVMAVAPPQDCLLLPPTDGVMAISASTGDNENTQNIARPRPLELAKLGSLDQGAESVLDLQSSLEDGGLDEMWQDMLVVTSDSWETNCKKKSLDTGDSHEMESGSGETNQLCSHSFVCKSVIGLVCEECGLVGQWIDNMFDNLNMSRVSRNRMSRNSKNKRLSHEFTSLSLLKEPLKPEVQPRVTLNLHPCLEEAMHLHQKEGFEFLCRNLLGSSAFDEEYIEPGGCILAHAPGTGKTCLIVSFLQSFLTKIPEGRPLIIAPKIILRSWLREFKKWEVEEILVYNLNEESQTGTLDNEEPNPSPSEISPVASRQGETHSRLKTVGEWFLGKGVLLVSYGLFAGLVFNGSSSRASRADKEICRMLLEGPGILILDEGHFPRNEKTKILKALFQVQTARRVLLSGTLFQNNFQELFTLLKLTRPKFMERCPEYAKKLELAATLIANGLSASGDDMDLLELEANSSRSRSRLEKHIFIDEIAGRIAGIGDTQADGEQICTAIEKLRHLTAPFIHWYGGAILDCLPGLQEFAVYLKLTESQHKAISNIKEERGPKSSLEQDIRFALVCIHPSLLKSALAEECESPSNSRMNFRSSGYDPLEGVKTTFVLDLLNFCHHSKEKVIIFSQFLSPLRLIETMLTNVWGWRKGHQMLRLDGSMSSNDRQNVIDNFNSDNEGSHVLLASLKACSEGISLVGASRIILLDAAWNPAIIRQAVSRAFRIGQQKVVYVYRMIAYETREETIYTKSIWKEWLSRALLDDKVNVEVVVKMTSLTAQLDCSVNGFSGDRFLENITPARNNMFWGIYKHNMA